MQGKNNKSTDSVRDQWKQQRSGGSHFAKPANAKDDKASKASASPAKVQSVRLPQVASESGRTDESEAKKSASLNSAMIPRVAAREESSSAGARKALISGASGVLPKIPGAKVAKKISSENKGYSRYNSGYFDRPDAKQITDMVAQFQTEPVDGAPAYSWTPFIVFGVASAVACIAWVVYCLASGAAPLSGGGPATVFGLVILAAMVVGALLVTIVTSVITFGKGNFEKMDVWASALGKAALMLFAALVLWIICNAVLS